MGNRQLPVLLAVQRAIEGQREHAEQTVEWRADLMAHICQKRRARLGHLQGSTSRLFELLVGLRQSCVGGFQLGGARRDYVFQLSQVLGQAILRMVALLYFRGNAGELLVGDVDQRTDLIVFMAGRAGQSVVLGGVQVACT